MLGRYGSDQLNVALLVVYLVLALLLSIFSAPAFLSVIPMLPLAFAFFRMLSRNTMQRRKENLAFLRLWQPIACKGRQFIARRRDREHRYFTCPKCRTLLRVPRGKGKITITCPKCREKLERKS